MRISGRLETFDSFDGVEKNALIYTPPTTFVVSPLGTLVEDLGKQLRDVAGALRGTLVVQQFERVEPSEEAIRHRAHQLWLNREKRNIPGSAESDWARARRSLLAETRDG
jgi:hypothetical protein